MRKHPSGDHNVRWGRAASAKHYLKGAESCASKVGPK